MAMFIRAKHVSDPFDDRVKARLFNDDSSGSEHESEGSCLSNLVNGFFDFEESTLTDTNEISADTITDEDGGVSHIARANDVVDAFEKYDRFRDHINKDVTEVLSGMKVITGSVYRRAVMARLRDKGYNAGVCKVKWEKSGGLTAGSYEYIDIIMSNNERYIVDLDFREQFEVARATVEYEKLVAMLPSVMVGKSEELRRVVRLMAEAAKCTLKSKDLSMPPWRKRRYMLNKWFGTYRRTVSALPSSASVAVAGRSSEIQYRVTGFDSVLNAQQV